MNLLLVSTSLPMPFASAESRWIYLLVRELAAMGWDVNALTINQTTAPALAEAQGLAASLGVTVRHVPLEVGLPSYRRKVRSLSHPNSEFLMCPEAIGAFDSAAAKADAVHIEGPLSAARLLTGRGRHGTAHVYQLDELDWERRSHEGASLAWRRFRAERTSRQVLPQLETVLVHSKRVQAHVLKVAPLVRTVCLPFGIDTRLYEFVGPGAKNRYTAGVIGSMYWYPSASAARTAAIEVWPSVLRRRPEAQLHIGGWGAKQHLQDLVTKPGVRVVLNVPSSEDFFRSIDVLLYLPSGGSGVKVKVLEAIAYGVPIVTNEYGVEGLDPELAATIRVVPSASEAVDATVALLDDPVERDRIASAARPLLESLHGPSVVASHWAAVIAGGALALNEP